MLKVCSGPPNIQAPSAIDGSQGLILNLISQRSLVWVWEIVIVFILNVGIFQLEHMHCLFLARLL